jgi:hypothetical protein
LPPAPGVINDLRPLSLGEILDRTFTVYRRNFWLFAGISAVSGAVQIVGQFILLLLGHSVVRGGNVFALRDFGAAGGNLLVSLLFLLASAVTSAATVYAIGEVYLARPVTVNSSLAAIGPRWLRYIGIMLWQIGSFIWLPLVVLIPAFAILGAAAAFGGSGGAVFGGLLMFLGIVGGGAGGFIFYLRNALAVQASVVEDLPVRPAMRRSKTLTTGTKGRIFIVLMLSGALYMVAGLAQFPATFAITSDVGGHHPLAQAWILLVGFAAHVLVSPVAMIGLSLLYFDQRIRLEAFDLAYMLGAPAAPYEPAPVPVPQNEPPAPNDPALFDYTTAHTLAPAPPPEEPHPEPPPIHDAPQP